MYKISFLDENGNEYMGTTQHFTSDGRYGLGTIDDIARREATKSIERDYITGYVVRRGRFINPIIKTVTF